MASGNYKRVPKMERKEIKQVKSQTFKFSCTSVFIQTSLFFI